MWLSGAAARRLLRSFWISLDLIPAPLRRPVASSKYELFAQHLALMKKQTAVLTYFSCVRRFYGITPRVFISGGKLWLLNPPFAFRLYAPVAVCLSSTLGVHFV